MGSTRERNPSLWIGTSSATGHERLAGELRVDVVLVGAGVVGLTAARLLAAKGMNVAVIEAGELCAGVTGYTTAKITSLHSAIYTRLVDTWGPERAAVYATANEAAIGKVRELASSDSIDCDLEDASAYTYTEMADGVAAIEREAGAPGGPRRDDHHRHRPALPGASSRANRQPGAVPSPQILPGPRRRDLPGGRIGVRAHPRRRRRRRRPGDDEPRGDHRRRDRAGNAHPDLRRGRPLRPYGAEALLRRRLPSRRTATGYVHQHRRTDPIGPLGRRRLGHGSRFDVDGQVLQGPAVEDLAKRGA